MAGKLAQFVSCFLFPEGHFKFGAETPGIPAVVTQAAKYINYLGPALLDTAPLSAEDTQSAAGKAFASVVTFLKALGLITGRKALSAMVESPEVKWDVEQLLPLSMQQVGRSLALWGSVDAERKDLEAAEHDWAFFAKKISLFETFSVAVHDPIMNESIFEHFKGACEGYVGSFLASCEKTLSDLGKELVSELQKFQSKHAEIVSSAETWQMQAVGSFFDVENEENVKSDIESTQKSLQTLSGLCDAMKGLLGHKSSSEEFNAFNEKAKQFHTDALRVMKDAQKTAGTLVMSSVFLTASNSSEGAKKDVMGALKFCEETFAISKDDLPTKLRKLVTDAVASSKSKGRKRVPNAEEDPNNMGDGEPSKKPRKKEKEKDSKKKEPKEEPEKKRRKSKSKV